MFAGHALGTRSMGAICALSASTFEFLSDRSRRTTHTLKIDHFLPERI